MPPKDRPLTPDGRYIVARGVLRRATNPNLTDTERRAALKALMQARLAARTDPSARSEIVAAKERLGEAGPPWWTDGAPDESGLAPERSGYADWWEGLTEDERTTGNRGR